MIDPSGLRVTVMGLGRFGGGLGVTRWLLERGARVTVTDLAPAEKLGGSVAALGEWASSGRLTLRLGGHEAGDFSEADLVVANPAVPRPWENVYLEAARRAGVAITTEIGLVVERLPSRSRVVGVTGSAGKSTTVSMIGHALGALGVDHRVGGNIGGSLLAGLERVTAETVVVLELSSFQLWWLGRDAWSPGVAVVTSFSENHADWHGGLAGYLKSKAEVCRSQRAGDSLVLAEGVEGFEGAAGVRVLRARGIGEEAFAGLSHLPGAAMRSNAVCAAMAVECVSGIGVEETLGTLGSFSALEHRMELVCERGGVRFINDSKCTTPRGARMAVETLGVSKVHLIAGGYDKELDLSPISSLVGDVAGLYTIGQTGDAIAELAGGGVERCGRLEEAVRRAAARAKAGEIVLLSPGHASWDQFENYEARGALFRELVKGEWEWVNR
ncbi:MAG: UDP-N-acetylmuramoyl-L-alanine--D-glutamate ligase [Phycisphaerales bacterium]|nr:UDP-N-acetylmuramoyl-L-alanine--D-glutamate ligase [Phycisphaerales bacterium]